MTNAEAEAPAKRHRRKLHFADTRYKAVPTGYIHVDKAMDRLGRLRYPDEWGYIEGFSRLPFQYETRERKFFQYQLGRHGSKLRLEKNKLVVVLRSLGTKLRRVNKIYQKVRSELKSALEQKLVLARRLTPAHDVQEISSLGIWAAQMRSVFYLGLVREDREGRDVALRVLIDEASFDKWLAALDRSAYQSTTNAHLRPGPRKISSLNTQTLEAIAAFAAAKSYRLTRKRFTDAVKEAVEAFGDTVSEKVLDRIWRNEILNPVKHRGGNPGAAGKEVETASTPGLVSVIKNGLAATRNETPLT